MIVVDLDLSELATLPSPPFGGEPAFVIVSSGGDPLGACFVPRVEHPGALADLLAARLGGAWRQRAVAAAIGHRSAWRAAPAPAGATPVTVVVCTMDRPIHLRRCLESVLPQLRGGDELLVVDNSAGGSGRRIAEGVGARWVHERGPGSSWARNRGYREASTPLVAYLDDDCVADRSWLEALREAFADPDVQAATGAVIARRVDLLVPLTMEERYPFLRGWAPRDFAGRTYSRDSPFDSWRVGTGASMAWRRHTLERLGGFDPALGAGTPMGSGEELDLFRRALTSGATIAYRPQALVWHDHPETLRGLRRMLVRYAVGTGARATKVLVEEGRRRPVRMIMVEWRRQLRWARREAGNLVLGRPRFPVLGLLGYAPTGGVGAVRFLRYRRRFRSPAT